MNLRSPVALFALTILAAGLGHGPAPCEELPRSALPLVGVQTGAGTGGAAAAALVRGLAAPPGGSLLASTFLGGSVSNSDEFFDRPYAVALDAAGNVYVAGATESPDFPAQPGALSRTLQGAADAYVAKFSPDLKQLLACTFFGGSGFDGATGLVVLADSVVIAGWTGSDDLPGAGAGYDTALSGSNDAFAARLSLDLSTVLSATYLGGGGYEQWVSLAVGPGGDVYLAGETASFDFPTANEFGTSFDTTTGTEGSWKDSFWTDLFVARLSADLSRLRAATYLGGTPAGTYGYGYESRPTVAAAGDGTVYVAGITEAADFPTTPGAYRTAFPGGDTAFVARFDAELTDLLASTAVGPSHQSYKVALALDPAGAVYLGGFAYENFPTTEGAFQAPAEPTYGGFVSKLSADLSTLLASTYLAGPSSGGNTIVEAVLPSPAGLWVAGQTAAADFPVSPGANDTVLGPIPGSEYVYEAFVARFTDDLSGLEAATFVAPNRYGNLPCARLATDGDGNVYVSGITSPSSGYRTTPGAFDESFNGGYADGFVARFDPTLSADLAPPEVTAVSPADGAADVPLDAVLTVTFSEPVGGPAVESGGIAVEGVPGQIRYDAGTNTATFTPDAPLAAGTTYTATVRGWVADVAGNGLGANHSWQFRTEAAPTDTDDEQAAEGGEDGDSRNGLCFVTAAGGAASGGRTAWLAVAGFAAMLARRRRR